MPTTTTTGFPYTLMIDNNLLYEQPLIILIIYYKVHLKIRQSSTIITIGKINHETFAGMFLLKVYQIMIMNDCINCPAQTQKE